MPDQTGKNPRGKIKASQKQVWKRGYRSNGPSTSMKVRTNVVVQAVVLLAAFGLIVNLARIMLVEHDTYTDMANSRQFRTTMLPAARGTIYEANGGVVAQSATVYKIYLDPGFFRKEMALVEKRNEELKQAAQAKRENGETEPPDIVSTDEVREQLIAYLAEILETPEQTIRAAFEKENNYERAGRKKPRRSHYRIHQQYSCRWQCADDLAFFNWSGVRYQALLSAKRACRFGRRLYE